MKVNAPDYVIRSFHPLLKSVMRHDYVDYWLDGGRGSTKSSFIGIAIVLLLMAYPRTNAVVFRRFSNTLRSSVYEQIAWAVGSLHLNNWFVFRRSPLEIVYVPTGQKIIFQGLDDPRKSKGTKFPVGYCAIQWFEELDEFDGWDSIQSVLRTYRRGGDKFWTFYSYNPPRTPWSWVNRQMLDIEQSACALRLHSDYRDVVRSGHSDWLGDQFLADAQAMAQEDERRYRWEFLGEVTGTGGSVFENVVKRRISDEEIAGYDNLRVGVDWGWFPDPWRCVTCEWQPGQRRLIIFGEKSANRTTPEDTGELVRKALTLPDKDGKSVYRHEYVWCDSAEPSSIAVYKRKVGLNARPADKGNMRRVSYQWLSGLREIVIDPVRAPHAFEEFTLCEFARDKQGNWLDDYEDGNDHSIDAVRYAVMRDVVRGV